MFIYSIYLPIIRTLSVYSLCGFSSCNVLQMRGMLERPELDADVFWNLCFSQASSQTKRIETTQTTRIHSSNMARADSTECHQSHKFGIFERALFFMFLLINVLSCIFTPFIPVYLFQVSIMYLSCILILYCISVPLGSFFQIPGNWNTPEFPDAVRVRVYIIYHYTPATPHLDDFIFLRSTTRGPVE